VLIGRRWLGERSGQPARIHDPADLVQREVASALAGGMRVIPLLIDGAAMPDPAQLPTSLQALTGRNALAIDNTRFAADLDRLLAALRPLVDPAATEAPAAPTGSLAPRRPAGWRWAAGAVALGLLGLALWAGLRPATVAPVMSSGPGRGAASAGTAAIPARAAINGRWQAEVVYDWPNAHFSERFEFSGQGAQLQGSASFLRVARAIEQGTADASGLRFVTRSTEVAGATSHDTEHRYHGQLVGDELRLTMQTVGASTPHAPVDIVARRAPAAPAR
jgi:hypothetical protein